MVEYISVQGAQALIRNGGLDVIDVREAVEWDTGHVPGARHVPLARVRAAARTLLRHETVLFICSAGARSHMAALLAVEAGAQQVYELSGGTRAWMNAGLPLMHPVAPLAF
jgi:rhodanese-related sulfurtransferase